MKTLRQTTTGADACRRTSCSSTRLTTSYETRRCRSGSMVHWLSLPAKYFSRSANQWTIDPDLHRRVSYDVVNLVDEQEVRRHASAPVVVCRNVFIYFSEQSIRRAV